MIPGMIGTSMPAARLDLALQEPDVVLRARGIGMDLREAGGADRELVVAGDQRDQLGRVAESARRRAPLGLALGRVAAEREHVVDSDVAHLVECPPEVVNCGSNAGEV